MGLFVSLRPFVTWLALTEDLHLPLLLPTNPWSTTRPDFWAVAAHPFLRNHISNDYLYDDDHSVIQRDLIAGTTTLSQQHYTQKILRTYGAWDSFPAPTFSPPGQRLVKGPEDTPPDRAFNLRYRGIVGSLGYLENMTLPDLAFPYSELSKYVECPQPWHMAPRERESPSLPSSLCLSLSHTHTPFRYPVQPHWYGQPAGHPRLAWEEGVNVLGRLSWLRRNTCS